MAKDRHHIIPKSRCRDLNINPNFQGNVIKVATNKHRAWHLLFSNSTPDEAIEIIRNEWSLSLEARAEFDSLRNNVELLRKRK